MDRDQLLFIRHVPQPVTVDGDKLVYIRPLTLDQSLKLEGFRTDGAAAARFLLAESVVDANGKPLFTEADIGQINAQLARELLKHCRKVNGIEDPKAGAGS